MKRIIAAVLVLALSLSLCACKSSDYKEAIELYEDEKYEQARDIFVELGDYEDSAQMVMECDYQMALEYLDDGEYVQARELLLKLGDYENSADLAVQAARGIVIEYAKKNDIPDRNSDGVVTRVTEENGQLLLVYAMGMSGVINLDVRVGVGISLDGTTIVVGTEEVFSHAADYSAEARGIIDISTYKDGDVFDWTEIDASGYNADGPVNGDSTLMLSILSTAALEETTAHLAQVLESSGLGLTMADIGFTSY